MSKLTAQTGLLLSLETPEFEPYKIGDHIPRHLLDDAMRQTERNWAWTTSDPGEDRRKAEELLERETVLHRLQLN